MTAKAEQKQRTRQAILLSAARALRREGLAGSTVGDVMKAAGLTVGGFYAHFRSKDDLLAQAMKTSAGQMWSRVLAQTADRPARDRVLAAVDAYLCEQHRDDREAGCLLPATVSEIGRVGQPYRTVLASVIEGFATAIAQLSGGAAGARRRALGLVALMYGGLSLARALGRGPLSSEVLAASRAAARSVAGVPADPGPRPR
jgi:TetR/AcrR family transcriptional regulator, transcriptional repressor for nem operon